MLAHDSPNKRVSSLGSESVRDCLGLRMYTMLALSKGAKAETFWHTHWQLDIFDRAVELVLRCPGTWSPYSETRIGLYSFYPFFGLVIKSIVDLYNCRFWCICIGQPLHTGVFEPLPAPKWPLRMGTTNTSISTVAASRLLYLRAFLSVSLSRGNDLLGFYGRRTLKEPSAATPLRGRCLESE